MRFLILIRFSSTSSLFADTTIFSVDFEKGQLDYAFWVANTRPEIGSDRRGHLRQRTTFVFNTQRQPWMAAAIPLEP